MSLATYLGSNFNMEITDELTTYNSIDIGYIFSEEENRKNVKEKHFSTKNVYEIEIPNPLYNLNVYPKKKNPRNYKKSQKDFIALCNFLKEHLNPGEFCEIYPCWLGEELEPKLGSLTIQLEDYNLDEIKIYEKYLVRLEK